MKLIVHGSMEFGFDCGSSHGCEIISLVDDEK